MFSATLPCRPVDYRPLPSWITQQGTTLTISGNTSAELIDRTERVQAALGGLAPWVRFEEWAAQEQQQHA